MFTLPKLPYAVDALAPHISAKTLELHHGKHHKAYVDKLNALLAEHNVAASSVEDVIMRSHTDPSMQAMFNNAAQCWNHEFLWNSMTPRGGGAPDGAIGALISDRFGDAEAFRKAFIDAAVGHFGSGWVWLVLEDDTLQIVTTHDANLPLVHGQKALLTCDVWEHAYYVDYENRRPAYVQAFLDHLANWSFANENITADDQPLEATH